MDCSMPFNIKNLSELIKKLHNREKFDFPHQFGSVFTPRSLQLATLSVLNLQINESLDILQKKSEKQRVYLERQIFVISDKLRKVGQIVKIISSLCQFKDPRQQFLAKFDTVNFYQSHSDYPLRYLNFLIGIFPSINVHKDNIPLYMPFYEKLDNYHSKIGNSNWEISRSNLDFIYKKQIMDFQETTQENWYLLLTGNRKILQIYNKTTIQQVWAYMYLFYMDSTLKPYRNINSQNQSLQQLHQDLIVDVISKKLQKQTDKEVSHLLSLILYVLTENTHQLENSYNQFEAFITFAQTNHQSKTICSEFGLTNMMYCQLLHNILDHVVLQGFQDSTQHRKLQFMLDHCIEKTENLAYKGVSFYDFYLRICFSSNTKDEDKLKRTHQKILSVLKTSLLKSTNGFPFPQYGWWEWAVLQPFSTCYLQKFPQKIIEVVKFLPTETAIWKLLSCEKLSNSNEFKMISQFLQDSKKVYVEQIQRKVNISENDYDGFLRLWKDFHQIVLNFDFQGGFEYQLNKVKQGNQRLSKMISIDMNERFKEKVYLPFDKSENILRAMNALIEGYEELLPELNENDKKTLLDAYLQILVDQRIKAKLIGALREQDATQFWKKWSLVYMNDQSLVNELMIGNQTIENQEMYHPQAFIIQEEGRVPSQQNHVEFMEL